MSGPREPGRDDAFAGGPYDLSTPPDWATFPGLYPPLYTQTPDAFFDWVAPFLPEIELRVLIYLIRRTLGFKNRAIRSPWSKSPPGSSPVRVRAWIGVPSWVSAVCSARFPDSRPRA